MRIGLSGIFNVFEYEYAEICFTFVSFEIFVTEQKVSRAFARLRFI